MVFECKFCSYKTDLKYNYKKHLITQKHLKKTSIPDTKIYFKDNENEKLKLEVENLKLKINNLMSTNTEINNKIPQLGNISFTIPKVHKSKLLYENSNVAKCSMNVGYSSINVAHTTSDFECIYCNKKYKHHSSLYRHQRDCYYKIHPSENVNISSLTGVVKTYDSDMNPTDNLPTTYSINDLKCIFCQNVYKSKNSLNKHIQTCFIRIQDKDKIEKDKMEKEKIILQKELEKEKAINKEKEKTIEIAKNSKGNITHITNNNNNRTINYLNTHFGNMIAMEQFLHNLENGEKLTFQERENLLISYKENGIDVFARNFSYIMKENCKRQLIKEGIIDMMLLPLFCSDGNLRSHKEKGLDGWKTHYDNTSINKMLNISNDQVYESHKEMLPIVGKERTRVYKEIKRDNYQNKVKNIKKII